MSISSLVLALAAAVPAQNALAVDRSGDSVALPSGPNSVAVYERRGGEWVPLAAGKLVHDFAFVGRHFVQASTVRSFADKRIAESGTAIDGLEPGMRSTPALVAGDQAFFWTETFNLGGTVVADSGDGLKPVGGIAPLEGVGGSLARASVLSAFSGERLAVVDQYLNDAGCMVTIIERGDGSWNHHESLRPKDCEPGGDDFKPAAPRLRVIGVALDGDRLALGTEPALGFTSGEVLLYRRGEGGWKQTGRIARPALADDPAEDDGFVPHGFGRRIVLQGPRAFIAETWSKPTETGYLSVHNGVLVMVERGGRWELEKHYVHAVRQATFGADFEVRGDRLYIDSMNELAAYVFERRDGEWHHAGRIPKEDPAPADPKAGE